MIYDYECQDCGKRFDIIKAVSEIDRIELCSHCTKPMRIVFHAPQLVGTKVDDAYYCPSHGQVVKSAAHSRELAKHKGWLEIGNERPEKHLKIERKPYD